MGRAGRGPGGGGKGTEEEEAHPTPTSPIPAKQLIERMKRILLIYAMWQSDS